MLLGGLLVLIITPLGVVAYNRNAGAQADREFGRQAQVVHLYLEEAHNTYHKLRFPDTSSVSVPEDRPTTIDEWRQRNQTVDAAARRAALHLRSQQKRELALRWLDLQRSMRSARIGYIDILIGKGLEAALVCKRLRGSEWFECDDRIRREGDRLEKELETKFASMDTDARAVWVKLAAIAPTIGEYDPY